MAGGWPGWALGLRLRLGPRGRATSSSRGGGAYDGRGGFGVISDGLDLFYDIGLYTEETHDKNFRLVQTV